MRINRFSFALLLLVLLFSYIPLAAQNLKPLTSREVVSLIYQLPRNPEMRDEIIDQIRKRGINFPLTDGMRSLVATKSGNDSVLRRTLEEAERRRVNPTASTLPSETEGMELLERARNVTLAAANAMPDFIVKQIVKRSIAYGNTGNWKPQDNFTVAVGFRASVGEEYKVLTINGMPPSEEVKATSDYSKYLPNGGVTTSGAEYISSLASIFTPEARAEFRMVDTDVIQTRRTVVYEYTVKKEFSNLTMSDSGDRRSAGSRGRVWIDRELDRVLRFEQIATEIPPGFPITAASTIIDFNWVTINERKYLLPTRSEVQLTTIFRDVVLQKRNDIRFRGYQKFSAELKIVDEVGEDDEPIEPETPPKPPKPIKPPQ